LIRFGGHLNAAQRRCPDGKNEVGIRAEDPARSGRAVHHANACVFVQAPSPDAAVDTAARRVGPMGGWRVGPDVGHGVLARDQYPEHAKPGGYTRTVILAPERPRPEEGA